ncbi:MAG: pyruvate, phosphate dikinase [Mycobacterium sp.]
MHRANASHPSVVLLDGTTDLSREILGNKGYGINAMHRNSLPVPPAFAITTPVCDLYFADPDGAVDTIWAEVLDHMSWLEQQTSRTFGGGSRPLLVSVRSGAAQSMPGMLDTVLDLGINDTVAAALGGACTPEFARDTRDRFRRMFSRIVLGAADDHTDADHVADVPDDPHVQLRQAIEAVFASWDSPRAVAYRRHHGLEGGGTAVVVQAMVFGNMTSRSGTGVLFSRNPITGSNEPFGEWLPGGQGEDVVSGAFDCTPLSALRAELPTVYDELMTAARALERLNADVQDIEFTVEEGKLWLLQTRAAKRSAQAAVRLALQLRAEGIIGDAETLTRVTPAHIETLLQPMLQPETRFAAPLLASGLPASPGVVSGKAYTDADDAIDAAEAGGDVILVRPSTSPDDVQGMFAARGIVTEVGGATSHAAVVSREIGRPTVVGCGPGVARRLEGKVITVDGTTGEVRDGALELSGWSERDTPDLTALTAIALEVSPLRAFPNGDHPILQSNSEAALREAMAAGHTDVVSATPLITMLTAFRLARPEADG